MQVNTLIQCKWNFDQFNLNHESCLSRIDGLNEVHLLYYKGFILRVFTLLKKHFNWYVAFWDHIVVLSTKLKHSSTFLWQWILKLGSFNLNKSFSKELLSRLWSMFCVHNFLSTLCNMFSMIHASLCRYFHWFF